MFNLANRCQLHFGCQEVGFSILAANKLRCKCSATALGRNIELFEGF